jgi:hypothetical protein
MLYLLNPMAVITTGYRAADAAGRGVRVDGFRPGGTGLACPLFLLLAAYRSFQRAAAGNFADLL